MLSAGTAHDSVARFNYASPLSLEQGATGFIVTCSFRRYFLNHSDLHGIVLALADC